MATKERLTNRNPKKEGKQTPSGKNPLARGEKTRKKKKKKVTKERKKG